MNAGAAAASGDQLLVLNDDVRLEESAVRVLREALAPEGVFAVAPRIVSPLSRAGDEGGKSAIVRAGLVEIEEAPSNDALACRLEASPEPAPSDWRSFTISRSRAQLAMDTVRDELYGYRAAKDDGSTRIITPRGETHDCYVHWD